MSSETGKCRQCDQALWDNVMFCSRCGTAVDARYADQAADASAEGLIARFGDHSSSPQSTIAATAQLASIAANGSATATINVPTDRPDDPVSEPAPALSPADTAPHKENFLRRISLPEKDESENVNFVFPEAENSTGLSRFFRLPSLDSSRVKKSLLAVGGIILVVGLAFVFNERSQRVREQQRIQALQETMTQPLPIITPAAEPASVTSLPAVADTTITESIRAALTAYNPQGVVTRYKFEVKDGTVMLSGDVYSQTEKSSVENIVRQIAGVKTITSNLTVKTDTIALVPQPQLNTAEARRLDEALLKQLAEDQKRAETAPPEPQPASPPPAPTPDIQREAERLRREQEIARLREEETALRKQMEERLQREADETRRRQEEQRVEAGKRPRTDLPRADASVLRSGTVAWSGLVDGTEEIVISGSSASVRHLSGEAPKETRASFSTSIPRSPVTVKLLSSTGRGSILITQEPSATNGYTTIVRIDDSAKGGESRYGFTLKWSAQ
jgi:hypothetical protein